MTPDQSATKGDHERILHSAALIWVSEHRVLLSHKKGSNSLGILEAKKKIKMSSAVSFLCTSVVC